ncbi:MAG: Ig-like domain-containing protein, partial [Myxococcaceae bacterium]
SATYPIRRANSPTDSAEEAKFLTLKNATFRTRARPIIFSGSHALFEDITLDGTLSGAGPADPAAPVPSGAVELDQAIDVTVRRLTATQMGAFGSVIAALWGSYEITVEDVNITGARSAVRLDGPQPAQVSGSTLTGNQQGLAIYGGSHVVFHNNIYGNSSWQAYSAVPLELSDTRSGSATFGQGNYWGHSCPDPLFVAGIDCNLPGAVDSRPFAQLSAWVDGGVPGCTLQVNAPVLTAPLDGGFLATATPQFTGTAPANAEVRILEAGAVRAMTTASDAGEFSVAPVTPLAEGAHTVVARALLGGTTSPDSPPISFTIDTVAPSAPHITTPATGATLDDGNMAFGGDAEPLTTVTLFESGTVVGAGNSDAQGSFAIAAALSAGSHSVTAQATDLAGNQSPPSQAVSVQVTAVSAATPIVGVNKMMNITLVNHAPNPFNPAIGQTNDLEIQGTVQRVSGVFPNASLDVVVTRRIFSAATGNLVRTLTAIVPVQLVPPNKIPTPIGATLSWDAKTPGGGLFPSGVYSSMTEIEILGRPLPPPNGGGTPNNPCPCFRGVCICDYSKVIATHDLLEQFKHPQPVCGTIPETCNGLDDNCDGRIDEGAACRSDLLCSSCVPTTCEAQFVTCGSAPDGCGGLLSCGQSCN